jgi:predicted nucleic acid-binding protein
MKSSRENERSYGRAKAPLSIFIDANTIVSGPLFNGTEALLKLGVARACELLTTAQVIEGVSRTLRAEEFKLSGDDVARILSSVYRAVSVRESLRESDLEKHYGRLNDKKDVHVLVAFGKLKCDILVTGDQELLAKVNEDPGGVLRGSSPAVGSG